MRVSLSTMLLAAQLAPLATADAGSSDAWPYSVQPFFLSALNQALTPADASYLGGLPVVVINHKQGGAPGYEEERQLAALSLVRAANASCATFFYLNSLIDFSPLELHSEMVKNGSWWYKTDAGAYITHNSDKIFDMSVEAARNAWLATAQHALSQPYISGVFVDKAGGFGAKGVSPAREAAWIAGHSELLRELGAAAVASKKKLIFNNEHAIGVAGQLFERWGQKTDHDLLSVPDDIKLHANLTGTSNTGQFSLARAGGVTPGTANSTSPEVCAAALAAMLMGANSPMTAFFACEPDFNSKDGWMNLNQQPFYDYYLGAPKGAAVVGKDGLMTRAFDGATVTLSTTSFQSSRGNLNSGCVQWASGETTGVCPTTV